MRQGKFISRIEAGDSPERQVLALRRAARMAVLAWIVRYNTRRKHSNVGHLRSSDYDQQSDEVLIAA